MEALRTDFLPARSSFLHWLWRYINYPFHSAIQSVQEHEDRNRVAFILRELCTRLSGERLFCSLSVKLCSLDVSKKTIGIVQLLNLLIATSPQLYSLRQSLQVDDKKSEIFSSLWTCWTQCPISSLCLALLGKRYELAYQVHTILNGTTFLNTNIF